jgi:acyl-CoA thioesterase FadM
MSSPERGPSGDSERYLTSRGRVEIFDTDASGLLFYGAPTRWFCTAETDFVRHFGLGEDVGQAMSTGGAFAPTRSVEIGLERPMRFLDDFEHHLWVSAVGTSSYAISHAICVRGDVCVRGLVRRVRVQPTAAGGLEPVPVTDRMRALVLADAPF